MPKTAVPEWLLARFVGPVRATAILGDLLEISTTRGGLWLWAAYARTLISLGMAHCAVARPLPPLPSPVGSSSSCLPH